MLVVLIGVNHTCPRWFHLFSLTCRTGSIGSTLACKSALNLGVFLPQSNNICLCFCSPCAWNVKCFKSGTLTGLTLQERREVWVKWRSPSWPTSPRASPKITACWRKTTESPTGEEGSGCRGGRYSEDACRDLGNLSARGLFVIDDKGVLRQITVNDLPVGRSVDETLRLVQAFQFTDKYGEGEYNPRKCLARVVCSNTHLNRFTCSRTAGLF